MRSAPIVLLACAALIAAAAHPSTPATASSSAAQDRGMEFRTKFAQARVAKNKDEMVKLIRTYEQQAVELIVSLCQAAGERSSDELEIEIDALRVTWKEARKSAFVDRVYEYYSLLSPDLRREHVKAILEHDKLFGRLPAVEAAKDPAAIAQLSEQFRQLGDLFEQIGSCYFGSQCQLVAGRLSDSAVAGVKADLNKATVAYAKSVELRQRIELEDRYYHDTKARLERLQAEGFGAPADGGAGGEMGGGEAGGGAGGAPAAAGSPIAVATTFALAADPAEVERPMWSADEDFGAWPAVSLAKVGSSVPFPGIAKDAPMVKRVTAAEIEFDQDLDGTADVKIGLTGNLAPVQLSIGKEAEKRAWAFQFITGNDKEMYQGVTTNLAPSTDYVQLYYCPAASVQGMVGETPIRVYDDNMDGLYGSPSQGWGYVGLVEGSFQPEMDSIAVGGSKRARPWSELQEIGGQWYRLESQSAGTSFLATPVALKTGTVKLDYAGSLDPTYVVIRGQDSLENCCFDLVGAGPKGAVVPVGRYQLYVGLIRKGKRREITKALMLPSRMAPSITVGADKPAVLKLGAPYGFDFAAAIEGEKLRVLGTSVAVIGVGGERYERLWDCVARPEVSWRKVGSKKGERPEKMPSAQELEKIQKRGYQVAWFPDDFEIELRPKEGEQFEVQLTEKKHKLFGAIESIWRQ